MMHDFQTGAEFSAEGFPALLIIVAVMVVVCGILAMRIVRRTGFSGWWGLLAAIPFVNIVALWVFAFRTWPIDERR
jgi:uncharacterized membrane protein YhaH (DUF805 family)